MLTFKKAIYVAGTGTICTFFTHAVFAKGYDKSPLLPDDDRQIEVIEVYAQKRAQSIDDVSVAVSAIDDEAIERLHIKDTTQLANLVPNMKITNNAGEGTPPAFNIRGIGMIDYNTSTISPIAVYNDGVVGGSANNLSVNLFDMEQAEVLRGPQGTLFGRNTTGGAILLRSRLPETEEFSGYISASTAQHQHNSFDGALNIPLSNNTAIRFAANHEDYQFSTNNLMPEQPDGGLKQTNLRFIIKADHDNFSAMFKLHSENWSGKPKPIASNGILRVDGTGQCSPSQAGSNLCQDAFGRQVGGTDFWDVNADTGDREHDTDSWGAALTLSWQLDDHRTLNAITGYKDLERFHSWDSDGPGNLIEGSMGTDSQLMSQEINLAINKSRYYWQSGIFWVKEEILQDNSFDLFRDFRAVPELAANAAEYFYDNSLENESVALYSQIEYDLSDKYSVTFGLRYTDEKTTYVANADLDTAFGVVPDLWLVKGDVDDQEFSGKLGINYQANEHTLLYGHYTRGYKSGGYNAGYSTSPAQAENSTYAPETLDAYELGFKWQLWQTKANWHLAAFYYDYKDQQVFVNIPDSVVPYHLLKNAGDSTIYGLDSEISIYFTNNLMLQLNIGYLPKANIGEYQEGNLVVKDTRLPFASKWNIGGYLLHESELFGKEITSQLGFDYQSDFYFDQNENPYTQQEGYNVLYGRVSYQVHEQVLVSVWGKNLTATEYAELRFDSIAALAAVTELKGEDRQLGIDISYSF